MLDALFVTPAVTAVREALGTAAAEGPLVVIGHAKIAAALAATREVIAVGLSPRAARKLTTSLDATTAIEDRSCAAVIGVDLTSDDGWAETLHEWSRVVRDGGAIVMIDRGHAAEASRRALCAGLSELEQRSAGRAIVTSGLISHLGG